MIRFILLCLLAPFATLMAQPQNVANETKSMESPDDNERISLHTNSSFLLVGETLLFSVHCIHERTGVFSGLSSVAYVELVSEDAIPVLQTRIALKNGHGSGDFFLPSTIRTGNYTLIAYTNWMKNFPLDNFFQTNIVIVNPFKKPNSGYTAEDDAQIIFFPEGGNMIVQHPNTVGYVIKLKDKSKNIAYELTIVDDLGNKVTSLPIRDHEKGTFTITPMPDRQYAAIITGLNTFKSISLPIAKKEGIGIHVNKSENFVKVKLTHSGPNEPENVMLNLQHNTGKSIYKSIIQFENDSASVTIPVKILPPGISRFYVTNSSNSNECERKIYIRSNAKNALGIQLQKNNFLPREKVTLSLKLIDSVDLASLSVSTRILDNQISTNRFSDGIDLTQSDEFIDFQMLTSPASIAASDMRINDLDKLHIPEIRGMLISGSATAPSGIPLGNEFIYLSVPATDYLFLASRTDSSGNFFFTTNKIKDDADVIFQLSPHLQSNYRLHIEDPFIAKYEKFVPSRISLDTSWAELIEKRSVWVQVENAFYKEKRDSLMYGNESVKFYGTPDKVYLLDNYVRFPSLDDVLIEYIPEISLRKKGDQYNIKVVNFKNGLPFDEDPLILLDGIPLFDHNRVLELDPLRIKKIEIIKRKYFYGPMKLSGIISLESYEGNAMKFTDRNFTIEKLVGLQPGKIRYQPDYDKKDLARIPDYRLQLYWNPLLVVTHPSTSVHFYTSDIEGDFEILVDGYDSKGNRLMAREVFTVKRP